MEELWQKINIFCHSLSANAHTERKVQEPLEAAEKKLQIKPPGPDWSKKPQVFMAVRTNKQKKVISKSCNVQLDQFDHANMELDGFKEAQFLKAQCRI